MRMGLSCTGIGQGRMLLNMLQNPIATDLLAATQPPTPKHQIRPHRDLQRHLDIALGRCQRYCGNRTN